MQDAEEPNLSTEMFGIPGDLEQSLCAGAKQKAVDFTLVLQRQRSQLMRQCEDYMDIAGGQKVPAARIEPAVRGVGLTLRTMPISTRNGEISITCLMESNFLWGVGRRNLRRSGPSD